MKKVFFAVLVVSCGFIAGAINWKDKGAEPAPAKYESFEQGVPKTWTLLGKGKLSTNPYHYKLGKKSLQWDFKAGDTIKVKNTIGDPRRRGLTNNICSSCFGVWIYLKEPLKGKNLTFEFCTDDQKTGYLQIPLNFKGWQFASASYHWWKGIKGKVSVKTNNIRIRAPKDSSGTIMIDLVVYNGPRYSSFANIIPNKTPWTAPKVDAEKYPMPETVNNADLKAIERIKSELLTPVKITEKGSVSGTKYYNAAMQVFKNYNIIEDEHGIRGMPVNLARDHGGGEPEFLRHVGISPENIIGYRYGMGRKYRYKNAIFVGFFNSSLRALKYGVTQAQYNELSEANVKIWKFLLDQGFNTSSGYGSYYAGTYQMTATAIYAFRDAIFKGGIMGDVFQYSQYKVYPLFFTGKSKPSMDYFANTASLFYLAFLYSNDPKVQVQAFRSLKDRLDSDITSDYGACGFKVDGCGYHVTGHGGGYTRNGLRGIAKVARAVSGSSFALSNEAFNILKKCALSFYFYSNNLEVPIYMQGTSPVQKTHPSKYKLRELHQALKNLALAAPNGCDKALAQAYVNSKAAMNHPLCTYYGKYDPVFEDKYGVKPSNPPTGNISMPYMPIVAQRRDNWLAVAYGGAIDMRQRGNHYGYYMGNGPLSIMNENGFHASGTEEYGWDWNRTNGATVLYMPDITGIKYIHAKPKPKDFKACIPKWFPKNVRRRGAEIKVFSNASKKDPDIKTGDGGISWRGINGCFRMIFYPTKLYQNFYGIKSYFFINNRIYALGSNIVSDNKKYHVQTNLYQKALYKTVADGRRKWKKVPLSETATYVDGKEITAFPVADKELDEKSAHHLVDPQGNGYYVPSGQKLFVARKHQKSRTTKYFKSVDHEGDFATAWLDHGIACQDGRYVYVVFPYCDKAKFAKFSGKDFEILRQDEFAHILHDKIDGFYAGIFFRGGNVTKLPYVKNVERDCQIMYKENNGKLEIAVGDPDTHRNWTDKLYAGAYGGKSELTALKVTFAGTWKLEKPVNGVKILGSDKEKTVIEFACIHGKTFNFSLIK